MTTRSMTTSILAVLVVGGAALVAFVGSAEAILPDGETAPVIYSASIADPDRHNELLEADLVVEAYDDDGIASYEYRFNRATVGAILSTSADNPTVEFSTTAPETRYVVEVRAVDSKGWVSDWVVASDAQTPPAPNLIVAGDSVASGYTRQWFTSKGTCVNPDASYGKVVFDDLSRRLPDAWAPDYLNVAWAGAGVHAMFNGGTDSCGISHTSQVDSIVEAADPKTWNIVVTTGAINSTNWGEVMTNLTKDTTFSFWGADDRAWCERGVNERWNVDEKAGQITSRVAQISRTLAEATNADLYWTSYYSVTGSRLFPGWVPIPHDCAEPMTAALDLLHSTILDGLDPAVEWIDIDSAPIGIQDWGGWPHPDDEGHRVIGQTVAAAIG